MILAISPTRMELLRLKRRIAIAKRGHKLLKDKQDELMRKFLSMIETARTLRIEVEKSLKGIFRNFIRARSINFAPFIDNQLTSQKITLDIKISTERFLNLELRHFELTRLPELPRYSFFETNSDLDSSLADFSKILPKMIELAEFEIKIKLISEEIKRTRRRVNALEYILIPNLIDTVNYINLKLIELERSSLLRLMRIKEVIGESV